MKPLTTQPRKLARTENPATSKHSALRVGEFAGMHHTLIERALRNAGGKALTVYDIADKCGISAHAIGKRMKELHTAKIAEPALDDITGEPIVGLTPSGRPARMWILVEDTDEIDFL